MMDRALGNGVELQKQGLFAAVLIKKRPYWPKYIAGDNIMAHFTEKGIGEPDPLQGMLDDVKFHVVAMKEPYLSKLTCSRIELFC